MKLKKIIKPIAIIAASLLCLSLLVLGFYGGVRLVKPSYSEKDIPGAITQICRDDYNITEPIQVKIEGKTLGVRITIENLFGPPERLENKKKATSLLNKILKICNLKKDDSSEKSVIKLNQSSIEEGFNLGGDLEKVLPELQPPLGITKEARPTVRQFGQAVRRVCLSTDAPIEFCTISLRDTNLGIESVSTFYIKDLRKTMARWVSNIDFSYFRHIGGGSLDSKSTGDKIVKRALLALGIKNKNPDWLTADLKSTPIDSTRRLYAINTKNKTLQTYSVKNIFLLINTDREGSGIEELFMNELPEQFKQYDDVSKWQDDGLFVKNITFDTFFANQISTIIKSITRFVGDIHTANLVLHPENTTESELPKFDIETKLLLKNPLNLNLKLSEESQNTLELVIKTETKDDPITKKIANLALWVIKNRCNHYKFFDFSQLKIVDGDYKEILTVNKHSLFEATNFDTQTFANSKEPALFQ